MRAGYRLVPTIVAPLLAALVSAGCGGGEASYDCRPSCPAGTHCAAEGCVLDGNGEAPDLPVPGDMAMPCGGQCGGATPYCGPAGQCVPCLEDKHCPAGSYCKVSGMTRSCAPGCANDAHCGALKCCLGECVDTARDARHCGACGTACMAPNSRAACTAGKCTAGACSPGWADCNQDPADGCEVQLHRDLANCGACGMACAPENGVAGCGIDGCFVAACRFGYDDCDGRADNGCEVSTVSDPRNCGGCAIACAAVSRAQVGCAVGECQIQACTKGFGDCNGVYNDGCEINLGNDRLHCGGCAVQCDQGQICNNGLCDCPLCSFPNAKAACVNKQCAIDSCLAGFANCDGSNVNGCEMPINSNARNCGGCGIACPQGLVCQNGSCTCPQCNIPNAKSACINNVCVLDSCLPGYANCDMNDVNGCEVSTDSDPKNCGGCGKACGGNTPFCLGGGCSAGGLHCADILKNSPNAKSGVYTIDPDGAGGAAPFTAYCDMTTAAGGWTLLLNLDTSDGHVMWWAEPLWEDANSWGDVNTPLDGDHKSPAWSSLGGTRELLLVVHQQGAYQGWREFRKVDTRTMFQYFADNRDNTLVGDLVLGSDTGNIAYAKERLVRSSTQLYVNHCIPNGGSCTTGNLDVSPDGDRISSNEATPANNDGGGLGNWHDMNLCCQAVGAPGSGKVCVGNAGFKSFRTCSEAQAGWGACWNQNQGGMFGTDSFLPPNNRCADSCGNANWAGANNIEYDYALFAR